MAVTTLYFGATAGPDADGTASTWAKREPVIDTGAINPLISGFDFTSNSLIARIGPGTHTLTTAIQTFTGTTGPSNAFPCILEGALSDGERWEPPDPDWCSAQPKWDDSTMPVLATTTNIFTLTNAFVGCRGIKFTASGRNSQICNSAFFVDWCVAINSTSNASAVAWGGSSQYFTNLWLECSGDIYSAVAGIFPQILPLRNIRMQGNAAATSGDRRGWFVTTATHYPMERVTVVGNVGGGIVYTSTGNSRLNVANSVIADNQGDGLSQAGTATTLAVVDSCMITGGHTNAINFSGTGKGLVKNTRMRGYTTAAIVGALEYNVPPLADNVTAAGTDGDEYVDQAGGDYRIKSTSTYWGRNIGAGDEPAAAGSVSVALQQRWIMYIPENTTQPTFRVKLPGEPIDVVFDAAGLVVAYRREDQTTFTTVTLAAGTLGTWITSTWIREAVGSDLYQLCLPAAAIASGLKTFLRLTYAGDVANGTISATEGAGGPTAAAANKIADHVRRRTQENVETSTDGDALSLGSLYGLIQQGQESNATATVGSLTVYRTDGTTVLGTKTLSTNATADPVDGIS